VNLLPWLLDWPPRPAAVVAFLLVTAFSVGTLIVLGGAVAPPSGENVAVESVDLAVRLNDADGFPSVGNGTVVACLGAGTPRDSVSVIGDVTVEVPPGGPPGHRGERLLVDVTLDDTGERTARSIEETGRVTTGVFWILEDDETLSVGEPTRLRIRVRAEGETIAETGRTVTVENGTRTYDCDRDLRFRPGDTASDLPSRTVLDSVRWSGASSRTTTDAPSIGRHGSARTFLQHPQG
jgi:hypothetical protein